MARIKCAAEGCREFAQAGTRYCHRLCQKSNHPAEPVPTVIKATPLAVSMQAGAGLGMFDSTAPKRLHRNERRANGCNAKATSKRQ